MKSFKIKQTITDRKDESLKLYFRDISKYPLLTPEEESELVCKVQQGDKKAENRLVRANLRFVVSVAKSYQGKGLDLVDLIQEGSLGMLEAAQKFNPNKGIKFISYAVWWIRQSIMKAISDNSRTIRVPISKLMHLSKIGRASEEFEQANGRLPYNEEVSNITGIDKHKIEYALSALNKPISLESPFKTEDTGCLIDVLPNNYATEADETVKDLGIAQELERIVNQLPIRESDIIKLLFGIGIPLQSLHEVSRRYGLSNERVRQIKFAALKHLRCQFKDEILQLL